MIVQDQAGDVTPACDVLAATVDIYCALSNACGAWTRRGGPVGIVVEILVKSLSKPENGLQKIDWGTR